MSIAIRHALLSALMVILLFGCTTAPERQLSREAPPYASLPNGNDPLAPEQPARLPTEDSLQLSGGLIPELERRRGHALNILELSGGGQNGAFGAGLLNGWSERGDRPQFDVVTGVSTGALLATHAFLGEPEDDRVLTEIFTHVSAKDIYRKNQLISLLFGSSALYDTTPLEELLDRYITADTLRRVAAAAEADRVLWVGATNLDYEQTWVWNLTEVARSGDLALYKKVLRASASPPIAFPPQEIAGHLFADGGTRQNMVVVGLLGEERPPPPLHGPGTVYVIQHGKRASAPAAAREDVMGIAASSLDIMLESSMDTLLMRSYIAARAHGYRFRLVSIPAKVDIGTNALAFDPKEMRAAYDAGHALGRSPAPWATQPPLFGDLPPWVYDLIGAGE